MSQKSDILTALQRGDKLSRIDCLNRFGCIEAGARITELRQEGHPIDTWMVEENGKRFAMWSIEKAGQLSLV